MSNKKIIGLNTQFGTIDYDGFEELEFCSTFSMLDYDAVVIDTTNISLNYNSDEPYENKRLLSRYDSKQSKW